VQLGDEGLAPRFKESRPFAAAAAADKGRCKTQAASQAGVLWHKLPAFCDKPALLLSVQGRVGLGA
jgi:hypothetical protein